MTSVAVEIVPASRRPEVSASVLAVVAIWALLAGVATWLERTFALPVPVCPFRRFTGVPCPTCGATRGAAAALDGRWLDAFLFNPLVIVAGAVIAGALLLRVLFARRVDVRLGPRTRLALWAVAATLFALNWAWVIARDL